MTTEPRTFNPAAIAAKARELGGDPLVAVLGELDVEQAVVDELLAWLRGCGDAHDFPPFDPAVLDPEALTSCAVCGLSMPAGAVYEAEYEALVGSGTDARD